MKMYRITMRGSISTITEESVLQTQGTKGQENIVLYNKGNTRTCFQLFGCVGPRNEYAGDRLCGVVYMRGIELPKPILEYEDLVFKYTRAMKARSASAFSITLPKLNAHIRRDPYDESGNVSLDETAIPYTPEGYLGDRVKKTLLHNLQKEVAKAKKDLAKGKEVYAIWATYPHELLLYKVRDIDVVDVDQEGLPTIINIKQGGLILMQINNQYSVI